MASQSDHRDNNNHQQQPPPPPSPSSSSPPPPQQQQQQEQPNKDSGQASESNHPPPTAGYPPTVGYPTMGYPPPPGQGGYPNQGYHEYPNNYYYNYDNNNNNQYHHYYPYAQAPPATYYNSHQSQGQGFPASSFVRGIIIGITLLVLVMFTTSLITWLILRPEIPVFHVETFSVSGFNASSPGSFTATWESNATVQNPNTRLRVYFDQIESFVYYDDDNILASAFVQPFTLDTKTGSVMHARLSANNSDQPLVGTWVVDQMAKERRNGTMSFSLRMAVWTAFKSGSWWTRHATLRIYCEDLKVAFVGDSGNANLAVDGNNNKLSDCVVLS